MAKFKDIAEEAEVAGDYMLAEHYVSEANNVDVLSDDHLFKTGRTLQPFSNEAASVCTDR